MRDGTRGLHVREEAGGHRADAQADSRRPLRAHAAHADGTARALGASGAVSLGDARASGGTERAVEFRLRFGARAAGWLEGWEQLGAAPRQSARVPRSILE